MQNAQDNVSPAINYLSQFYMDIENLTTHVSNYNNLLAYLNNKYPDTETKTEKTIEQNDYNALDNFSQQCRFWANRIYTKYCALLKKFPEFEEQKQEIDELYKKIATERIVSFDDVQKLNISFNSLFINGICDKFFVNTENAFSKMTGG